MARSRRARVADIAQIATSLPEVTVEGDERPSYKVKGKAFVFFRGPRPDAVDETGERLTDVIGFRVPDEADKFAMAEDASTPWFTTPHFNGYKAILVQESRLGELSVDELREVVQDAWLSVAPKRLAKEWLADA